LIIKLRQWHLPWPLGRNSMGLSDDLKKLTLEECRRDYEQRYLPNGAILALAGNVEFEAARQAAAADFGDWAPRAREPLKQAPPPGRFHHEHQESEQTHIGLAWPGVLETDPDHYVVRLAIEVLSGGMSGRLFTEVREKRGLAYSVWAGYSGMKEKGFILGYAGTSNERAQETLDCFLEQVRLLSDGVTAAELARAKTGLKAGIIMQGESTSARAGAIAHDYFIRGRIRTLDEIKAAIDAVTLDSLNAWLKANPAGPFTIVTVGPKTLKLA
jgi:predicted Zn-dependent peptidase